MVLMPYGTCGTVSHIGQRFLWSTDYVEIAYMTGPEAIMAAVADCEATYLQDKASREAVRAMNPGSR
jgi:hypothetical protein